MPTKLIGAESHQVPRNADLGTMAFQDHSSVNIEGGTVTAVHKVDTNISESIPSLVLDFARAKTVDSRVTYTRNSTATYYDQSTTAKAEENLLQDSQSLHRSTWGKNGCSILTDIAILAPDGTYTGQKIVEDTTNGVHYIGQTLSSIPSTVHTISIFAKQAERTKVGVYFGGAGGSEQGIVVDLTNGTFAANIVNPPTSYRITPFPNGWYRISVTSTGRANAISFVSYYACDAANNFSYQGDGTSGVYVWGAQAEQRSGETPYINTTVGTGITGPRTNHIPVLMTSAANVPRINYDPITRECKGFLIEGQRTNLLLSSSDFENAIWTKARANVTSNIIVGPDGTLTGDKLVEDTAASNTHQMYQGGSTTAGSVVTGSIYLKAAERTFAYVQLTGTSVFPGFYVNLVTGAVGTSYNNPINVTVTPVGNGWYRCTITATTDATSTFLRVYTAIVDSVTGNTYTGDGYSGLYVWGAQLETGASPTSYIPTTDQQKTRVFDLASIAGTSFTSFYNQAEGTMFAEFDTYNGQGIVGTYTNPNGSIRLTTNSGTANFAVENPIGTYPVGIAVGSSAINTLTKSVGAYKRNDFAVCQNGGTVATDTLGEVPIGMTELFIGRVVGTVQMFNGNLRRIEYYPTRLTNAELQEMTTL